MHGYQGEIAPCGFSPMGPHADLILLGSPVFTCEKSCLAADVQGKVTIFVDFQVPKGLVHRTSERQVTSELAHRSVIVMA